MPVEPITAEEAANRADLIEWMKKDLALHLGRQEGLNRNWRWVPAPHRCYALADRDGCVSFGAGEGMDCRVPEMLGLSGTSEAELYSALETAHDALFADPGERMAGLVQRALDAEKKLAGLLSACRRIYTRGHNRGAMNGWTVEETGDEFLKVIGPLLEVS